MNRETSFQKTVKYVIYMTAVACAFCQFILLFSEFDYLSGIGTVLNMFYHLAGVACPVLIFLLFFKENDEKDVYGGYLIGGQLTFGGLAGLAILIKYIGYTKNTSSFSTVLVVFLIISIIFELGTALLYFLYGMDRMTCVLPVICFFVSLILKSEVYD